MFPTARLENWEVRKDGRLWGRVYGHTKFEDATEITTSKVVRADYGGENPWAQTQNTLYNLGKKQPHWNRYLKEKLGMKEIHVKFLVLAAAIYMVGAVGIWCARGIQAQSWLECMKAGHGQGTCDEYARLMHGDKQ